MSVTVMVPVVHHADVVLSGRRKEVRMPFRLDVPVELPELVRGDLRPGIDIADAQYMGAVELPAWDGRLWQPFIPATGPDGAWNGRRLVWRPGGARLSLDEMAPMGPHGRAIRAGHTPPAGDWSPGSLADARPDPDMMRLVDAAVKELLWSSQPAVETAVRRWADRTIVVDGEIWCETREPHLVLVADETSRRIAICLGEQWHRSSAAFRLDRLDEAVEWANSAQGSAAVPLRPAFNGGRDAEKSRDVSGIRSAFHVHDPALLRRDDARVMLHRCLPAVLDGVEGLLPRLGSVDIDRFLAMRRFRAEEPPAPATPDLYADFKELIAGAMRLSGLSPGEFKAREKARSYSAPALARWRSHEAAWHARQALAAPPAP